jgi:hypothetical protein
MACLVSTNLALVTTTPACAAFLLVRAESPRWRTISAILATSVAGAGGCIVTLGALNRPSADLDFSPAVDSFRDADPYCDEHLESIRLRLESGRMGRAAPARGLAAHRVACCQAARGNQVRGRLQVALLALVATWLLLDVLVDTAFFRYSFYTSYSSRSR